MPKLLTDHGYPTRYGISRLREWRIGTGADICNKEAVEAYINLIEAMWWTKEFGVQKRLIGTKINLELHTLGWSGNETIIGELQRTFFWMFFWQMSRRGGHYWFEVDLKSFKTKVIAVPKNKHKPNVPARLHAKKR